ncbi:helicase Cas3, CRISPR-associated, core [Artemisia annua]|uniref:Helicase Cas3, CRISPR-associated, core n=1 Tax=Artemisia annua TaxID=35608 RepID=A0A2U1N814_ARTAN|nr:helicase Cas3, CRISPR-associated, core [Artemisia annua]
MDCMSAKKTVFIMDATKNNDILEPALLSCARACNEGSWHDWDQMLNIGFAEDVETILEYLPKQCQTMMFSATMPSWIVKLMHKYLKTPLTIDLVGDSDQKLPDGITLYSISSEIRESPSIIGPLITNAKGCLGDLIH